MISFLTKGKLLLAVLIAAFMVQENGTLVVDFAETYDSYQKKIYTYLDQALKLVDSYDGSLHTALSAAKTELKSIQGVISNDQKIILENLSILEKTAMLSSQQLLYHLKNNTEDYIWFLQQAMPKITQDLEYDITKRVEDAGGNAEKLRNCEQTYEIDLKKTMDWLLASQGGCIMDQVGDGELIVEDILKISAEITTLLTEVSVIERNGWDTGIKVLMGQIEELSGTFPVDDANIILESKSEQVLKFQNCSVLKISQFFITTLGIIEKIVECTKIK